MSDFGGLFLVLSRRERNLDTSLGHQTALLLATISALELAWGGPTRPRDRLGKQLVFPPEETGAPGGSYLVPAPPQLPSGLYELPDQQMEGSETSSTTVLPLNDPSKVRVVPLSLLPWPLLAGPKRIFVLQAMKGMPFDYTWDVRDPRNAELQFSHAASSDGFVTRGEYRVMLPDGRLQVIIPLPMPSCMADGVFKESGPTRGKKP